MNHLFLSKPLAVLCVLGASVLVSGTAWAQAAHVQVDGAWARASVQGQTGTGAFMRLVSKENTRLVRAETPVAGVTEVHEMKMEGDVMRMRAVPMLALPAGQAVELKPGGYHLMLMDLKAPLAKGSSVPITLVFEDAKGQQTRQSVTVPVATSAPHGGAAGGASHGHKH
jgi:copper(I)-binding protein